jgi:hypothetical protein
MTNLRVQSLATNGLERVEIYIHGIPLKFGPGQSEGCVEVPDTPTQFVRYRMEGRPGGTLSFTIDRDGRIVFTQPEIMIAEGCNSYESKDIYFQV